MIAPADMTDLDRWIRANWDATICTQTVDDPGDEDTARLALPFPYTVPSPSETLHEMYYWDTFFTNLGLIRHGRLRQVEHNIRNLLYLLATHGKVLNGNLKRYLSRSQPPLLTAMVADCLAAGGDPALGEEALDLLLLEHDGYWEQPPHLTETGLNRYYDAREEPYTEHYPDGASATLTPDEMAMCESGWDMNPRMAGRARTTLPVELNAILYRNERQLAGMLEAHGRAAEAACLRGRAAERRALMIDLFRGDDGYFYDFDLARGERIDVVSIAPAALLWAQALTPEEAAALRPGLLCLETDWGVVTCLHDYGFPAFQWNWPMGWAPLQWWTVDGLRAYGYHDDARRLVCKYLNLLYRNWQATGQLWEKYNIVKGNIDVVRDRYTVCNHLGWTAGVFAALWHGEMTGGDR